MPVGVPQLWHIDELRPGVASTVICRRNHHQRLRLFLWPIAVLRKYGIPAAC